MARTKQGARFSTEFVRPRGARSSLRPFEKEILKYYPKKFRLFKNAQLSLNDIFTNHYRPMVELAEDYSPHQRILRKYRADFFQSFKAFYELEGGPMPTRIPHNIKHLIIREGSSVFLKKLIKHNKGLKHITLHPESWEMPEMIANHLKYSKSLFSIRFEESRPFFSERICRNMRRNWKNTMQRVEMLGNYFQNPENITRVMETILQFPKLKELRFLSHANDDTEHFPLAKLQERNIAYDVRFRIGEDNSELKPVDWLIISERDYKYNTANQMMTTEWKFQNLSQKILRLDHLPFEFHPLPLFEKISSLDVKFDRIQSDYSSFGHLKDLKNLSLNITNASYLKDFLDYFHENVAQQIKLETISLKGKFRAEFSKKNTSALIRFFGVCAKTVRKANFEFKYKHARNDDSFADFHKVLSKLKHLTSLSLSLSFSVGSGPVKQFEKLIKIISGMKSLEELNFKIKNARFDDQKLNLTFPSQLKKLNLGVVSYRIPFDLTKALLTLSNLTDLELEFANFSSQKFSKMLLDLNKFKSLERLVLKEVEALSSRYGILQMKPILDNLMKECLSLKLIIFANINSRETIVFRRNCSWSEINLKCDELSSQKHLKMIYIESFSD